MSKISVVIPVYNEKSIIGITLTKVVTYLNDFNPDYEIIVVDDGSLDDTSLIVEEFSAKEQKISLVKNSHKGKGFAVRTGVLKSKGDFVLMFDADSSTPIEELKRLMVWITDNSFDIAIASREGIGAKRKNEPLFRHIMGRVFNTIVRVLLLPGIMDTQCGFKLFKGDIARTVFGKSRLYGDLTKETRVPKVTAFDVEILYLARKMGKSIKAVPVTWEYRSDTRVRSFRDSFVNLGDVLKVKINDLRGLYPTA
ncbi:MAG: dolichyl-phosphate beta-glucosyltransferase [Patescibacteria group bacterium]